MWRNESSTRFCVQAGEKVSHHKYTPKKKKKKNLTMTVREFKKRIVLGLFRFRV
jgi:hypothetical protein